MDNIPRPPQAVPGDYHALAATLRTNAGNISGGSAALDSAAQTSLGPSQGWTGQGATAFTSVAQPRLASGVRALGAQVNIFADALDSWAKCLTDLTAQYDSARAALDNASVSADRVVAELSAYTDELNGYTSKIPNAPQVAHRSIDTGVLRIYNTPQAIVGELQSWWTEFINARDTAATTPLPLSVVPALPNATSVSSVPQGTPYIPDFAAPADYNAVVAGLLVRAQGQMKQWMSDYANAKTQAMTYLTLTPSSAVGSASAAMSNVGKTAFNPGRRDVIPLSQLSGVTITVSGGDTLSELGTVFYGPGNWKQILNNPSVRSQVTDPNKIETGWTFTLTGTTPKPSSQFPAEPPGVAIRQTVSQTTGSAPAVSDSPANNTGATPPPAAPTVPFPVTSIHDSAPPPPPPHSSGHLKE